MGNAVVYKYVYNGEVVYVGQTNRGIQKRVKEHCKEIRFMGLTNVEYYEVEDEVVARKHEAYWIAKYKPILNIQRPSLSEVMKRKPYKIKWVPYPYEIVYDEPLIKIDQGYIPFLFDFLFRTYYVRKKHLLFSPLMLIMYISEERRNNYGLYN